MDENDVELLARHENSVWASARTEFSAADDQLEALPAGGEWHAYRPLACAAPDRRWEGFRFLDATAIGTVLVFRFTWTTPEATLEYLLHLDMHDQRERDGASTRVLERVTQLVASPDWHLHRTAAISERVRVVLVRSELRGSA